MALFCPSLEDGLWLLFEGDYGNNNNCCYLQIPAVGCFTVSPQKNRAKTARFA